MAGSPEQGSKVPEFGDWDNGDSVPYTTYFDNATKAKGDRLNPDDPFVQREGMSDRVRSNYEQHKTKGGVVKRPTESPLHRNAVESRIRDYYAGKSVQNRGQEAFRSKHRQNLNSEDGNMKKHPDSPLHHPTPGQLSSDLPLHQHHGTTTSNSTKRTTGKSTGSDRSIENSPRHLHHLPRTEAKSAGVSSPSWERRGSPQGGSHGLAPVTPGRSRLPSVTRGNETPDHSTTVPKFGDWDESDPASSDHYTDIFTRVRVGRQSGEGSFPAATTDISHSNSQNRSGRGSSKTCCCFPWRK